MNAFSLFVLPDAQDSLAALAALSPNREVGGILIGYRADEGIVVEAALHVNDPGASGHNYTRRSEAADLALEQFLKGTDSVLSGYVGEWHSHPLPCPPSGLDRDTMRSIGKHNRDSVALIVAARRSDSDVVLHGLATLGNPRGWLRRPRVFDTPVVASS